MYRDESMLMVDESMLEVLQIGGFDWDTGKMWVPQENGGHGMRRISRHDALLSQPYSVSNHVYALDHAAAFVIANTSIMFAGQEYSILLPIKINVNTIDFLDVKVSNTTFSHTLQRVFDREGIFCGVGGILQIPSVELMLKVTKVYTQQLHVAGVRHCGIFVTGLDRANALQYLTSEADSELKKEAFRIAHYGTVDDFYRLLALLYGEVRKDLLEQTSN